MSAPVDVVQVLARIAKSNADFATTASPDFIVRVGESMLKKQSEDLLHASSAVAQLIKAAGNVTGIVQDDGVLVSFDSLADLVTALILVQGGAA